MASSGCAFENLQMIGCRSRKRESGELPRALSPVTRSGKVRLYCPNALRTDAIPAFPFAVHQTCPTESHTQHDPGTLVFLSGIEKEGKIKILKDQVKS
jgi:hypothetical protein